MTIEESKTVLTTHREHWERLLSEGICDAHEGKETISALTIALASLEAWEKVRQEVQAINAYEVLTDGEVHINSCKNKTGLKVKMEALAIIDKHLQEVEE